MFEIMSFEARQEREYKGAIPRLDGVMSLLASIEFALMRRSAMGTILLLAVSSYGS